MPSLRLNLLLFLAVICPSLWAFEGVGDCQKLLSDFAVLTKKSAFIPVALSGNCIVKSERDFPLVLKSAGFHYKEKSGVISLAPIPQPVEKPAPTWKAQTKNFKIDFAFINVSSALDCGITLKDVLFSFENLSYSFSVGGSLGCPALDNDGSFTFSVNASLTDSWSYTHGTETQRAQSEITSATGAVTTNYSWITTGLDLKLEQKESGVFYSLRYTSKNGSVSTSSGLVADLIQADILEEVKQKKKLWILPLGYVRNEARYKLVLKVTEVK